MCLSDFKAMRWFELPISRFRDFTRSYDETSYWILKRGQGSCCPWGKVSTIFAMPMSRDGMKSKYVYMFSTLNHHGPAPHICIAIFNACLPSAPNMRRWFQWSSPQCHIYGALQTVRPQCSRQHFSFSQQPVYSPPTHTPPPPPHTHPTPTPPTPHPPTPHPPPLLRALCEKYLVCYR